MAKTPEFPGPLRLIDERSVAFRAAVASAPSLEVRVPTCPEWTLLDLARHLGEGRRRWAAVVAARPDGTPPAESPSERVPPAPRERDALPAWSAEPTEQLLGALRESGPDRGCWTWWGGSAVAADPRCRRPDRRCGSESGQPERRVHRNVNRGCCQPR